MKLKFDVAWYPVTDMAEAKRFYCDILGFQPRYEMDAWAEYSPAPGSAALAVNANNRMQTTGATVVFSVDDLDEAQRRLGEKGVSFEGEIYEVPGVVRVGTLRDPFGNRLQLAQSLLPLQS